MNNKEGPVLTLKQGQIRGVIEESIYGNEQYFTFRGIPYARPPVGQLRFKDPLPAEKWIGIRDGSEFGNIAAQIDKVTGVVVGSDDCLYLNVYTPRIELSAKLAVMVWIHGGGFTMGSGNDEMFKPDYIIRKDTILVTFNFRLGCLGYLNLEDEVASGNQAMKDKVMALRWIRDNIAVFGGDPGSVTIFGGSSGASAVHYLSLSPLADGLFHKAIIQSGTAHTIWSFMPGEPKKYGYELSNLLGFKSFDPKAIVDFLQKVSLEELIKFQFKVGNRKNRFTVIAVFLPSVDNKSKNPFLPVPPPVSIKFNIKVPFMLGFNENEGGFFFGESPVADKITGNPLVCDFEDFLTPSFLNILKERNLSVNEFKRMYFGDKPFNKETKENVMAFLGDYYFTHYIFDYARILPHVNKCPSYLYKFSYDPKEEPSFMKTVMTIQVPGTIHGDELDYLFYGTLHSLMYLEPHRPGTPSYKVMDIITQLWTDFAKTGNPTPKITDLIPVLWEPLKKDSDTYDYFNINESLRMESIRKGVQRCEWNPVMKNKL